MGLTAKQVSELGERLDARYRLLLGEVHDEFEHGENQQYAELIGRVPADIGDQSVADALADLNVAIVDRHIEELRDIEAAKARIANGTFAACIACGDDIAFERLLAYPTAKRCIRCQRQRERTYAHGGTPTL
ncbi:MAG TPA: TraR/DksA family transcriptional regulator [Casimicrobiaceae bacterium]